MHAWKQVCASRRESKKKAGEIGSTSPNFGTRETLRMNQMESRGTPWCPLEGSKGVMAATREGNKTWIVAAQALWAICGSHSHGQEVGWCRAAGSGSRWLSATTCTCDLLLLGKPGGRWGQTPSVIRVTGPHHLAQIRYPVHSNCSVNVCYWQVCVCKNLSKFTMYLPEMEVSLE